MIRFHPHARERLQERGAEDFVDFINPSQGETMEQEIRNIFKRAVPARNRMGE